MSQRSLGRPGRIGNITFTNATTERWIELPLGGRGFELFARSDANIRWSYKAEETLDIADGDYRTIPSGERGGETGILVKPQVILGESAGKSAPQGKTEAVRVYISVSAATVVEFSIYDGA